MSNLTILNTAIRQLDNLFNLKDLHHISGNEKKHEPYLFIRLDTTKELIAEIQKEDPTAIAVKSLRGTQGGTYACMEIALAYAMWIDPKFHLIVLRAYMAMKEDDLQNAQQMLPLAQADLVQIVQAVQQAIPQPKEIYQARNLHEVLPLAFLYNKIAVLAEDFLHLYKFLHQKGHGTMAEICKNHFNALNADTALMNRASCCIQRLTLDLSDEDQDTVRRLCLG